MLLTLQAAIGNPSQHMDEGKISPALDRCPICSAGDLGPLLDLQFDPDVALLRCKSCGAGFASRMPTPQALKEYYASYYDVPKYGDLGQCHVHFSKPARLARHIARCAQIQQSPAPILRLFDFGGGDGTIAIMLGQQILGAGCAGRVEITLVDYNSPRPVHDSRLVIRSVQDVDILDEAAFDIGIASASLEHIPGLRDCLLRLLSAIRPGGCLYIRTPGAEPIMRVARLIGLDIDFGYPAHLYDLGEKFWQRILETLDVTRDYTIRSSRPAIVESSFSISPCRTLAAYMLKAPWWVIGGGYGLVGGWEIVIGRISEEQLPRG